MRFTTDHHHRFTRSARSTGISVVFATLVLLTAPLAHASPATGEAVGPVATQQIDGVTFPADFPRASLNTLKVSTPSSFPIGDDQALPLQRAAPRNTTAITTDLYVPGKIQGVNGEPPLAHCRNLANGQRQCVTPAPAGGW